MSKRPRRARYRSESDWLIAVIRWLGKRYPGDQGARVDHWRRIDAKEQAKRRRSRLGELLGADDLSDDELAELDRLIDQHVADKRLARTTDKGTRRTK